MIERVRSEQTGVRALDDVLAPQRVDNAHVDDATRENMVSSAETARELERQRLFDEAREAGLRQGLEEAEKRVRAAIEEAEKGVLEAHAQQSRALEIAMEKMDGLLSALSEELAKREALLHAEVAELAYTALCRLVGTWQADRESISKLSQAVVAEHRHRPAVLHVSPNDLPLLANLEKPDLRIEADPRLDAASCRLEGPAGDYETSMEFRLKAIKEALVFGVGAGA